MKIILSHDVDHWEWKEHITDGFLFKFLVRNLYIGLSGKISFSLLIKRVFSVFSNKITQLESILSYEKSLGVTSTVFLGVANGLGLSYTNRTAQKIINVVKSMGFSVGIHGIEFDDLNKMRQEKERFSLLSGLDNFGIRNHYLRMSKSTHKYMSELGYLFDSTSSGIQNHSKVEKMIVFPISIMDVDLLSQSKNNIDQIKQKTLDILKKAKVEGQQYFVVNFHDNYFSDLYPDHKLWFMWFTKYLVKEKFEFVDYYTALREVKL